METSITESQNALNSYNIVLCIEAIQMAMYEKKI